MAVLSRAISSPFPDVFPKARLWRLLSGSLIVVAGLLLLTTHHAAAVGGDICTTDTAGANDQPGQKDLTRMCANYDGLPATLGVRWQWDEIGWSGSNTGDACSLYDTNGNGNADYALCVTVKGNPANFVSKQLYACTADAKNDRCTGPTPISSTSVCAAGVQGTAASPVDPFSSGDGYPKDTVAACTVNMSDIGGGKAARLIDVCSYPSQEPNSDPSDCVVTRAQAGKLEVRKSLSPAADSGRFNLLIDNVLYASAVGDGGTTGTQVVDAGAHTVGENASGTTNLADYTTTVECRDLHGTGSVVASGTSAAPLSVNVVDGADIVCTIANKRNTGYLLITKQVNWNGVTPDTAQTFQICVTGPSFPTPNCKPVGYEGGSVAWYDVLPGMYNVTETDPGGAWDVNISPSAVEVTVANPGCATVTNTRRVGSLTVHKTVDWNGVTADPNASFQICLSGPSFAAPNCKPVGYQGGDVTWTNLLPGDYTVSETNPGAEWAVTVTGSPAKIPPDGTPATVQVSNVRKQPGLTVTKVVDWKGMTPDPNKNFVICITGPTYPNASCQGVGYQGGVIQWSGLAPGAYTITENNPGAEWSTSITGSPATVPESGPGATASVVNTRNLGRLEVTKRVNWSGSSPDPSQNFEVCITGPSFPNGDCQTIGYQGGLLAWDKLMPGTYIVREPSLGDQWTANFTGTPAYIPDAGGVVSAAVDNVYKLGRLDVTKVVELNGLPDDPSQSFAICISGPSFPNGNCKTIGSTGGVLSWIGLIPGSYVVSENDPGSHWVSTVAGSPAVVNEGQATTATVTNARKRGSLTVTKVVEWSGTTPDPNQVFQICIQGPSYANPDCKTAKYDGAALNWPDLIPGDYQVWESALGSEWGVTVLNPVITIKDDGSACCTGVINTRKLGSLDVTKVVNWNGITPDESLGFQLCITGPSFPNGDCKTINYDGGVLHWEKLIPGAYVVHEQDPGAAWAVSGDGVTVNVPDNGGAGSATVTNTHKRAGLTVTKNVDWKGIAPDPNATFSVCITGPSFPNGDCKQVGYQGGVVTWDSLLPGDYVVSEPNLGAQWTAEVLGSPVKVAPDTAGSAIVNNTRKLGVLSLTKVVNWNGAPVDPGRNFSLCITGPSYLNGDCKSVGPNGGVLTWGGLIPGQYAVSETGPGSSWTVDIANPTLTVPDNGGTASGKVTNTLNLGSLAVTKTVNWNGIPVENNQSFSICITGPSFSTPNCQAVGANGGVLTWNNLIPGFYTVAESDPGNAWQVSITGSPVEVVTASKPAAATVANTRRLGRVQVTKTVDWNGLTVDSTQQFQICIQGPSYPTPDCKTVGANGGVLTWDNVIPGEYVVTEPGADSVWSVAIDGSPVKVTANGCTGTAIVTNSRKRGNLTLTKVVDWSGIPVDANQHFDLCITGPSYPTASCQQVGPNGGSMYWTNLTPGDYTVSERDPGSSWLVQVPNSPVTVPAGEQGASASVTNVRKRGSLELTKTVAWNGIARVDGQTYQLCITGPTYPNGDCKSVGADGGVLTWDKLIPGSYTVKENDPGSSWTVQVSANQVTVPTDGGKATATITNARKLGSLLVTKTVNWNDVPVNNGQGFQICITGPSYPAPNCQTVGATGGVLTWNNLIPGAYTVSETDPGADWSTVVSNSPATVPVDGGSAQASVTNTHKRGSLSVTKVVEWNGVTVDAAQRFPICIQGPSFPTGDCQVAGPAGGVFTWPDLIPGAYVVYEKGPGSAWSVQVTGSPAQVSPGAPAAASIVNTRKLGSLVVTKYVNWNGAPVDNNKTFELCITGPSYPSGNCKTTGFAGGALRWEKLIPGEYTVRETDPGKEWTMTTLGSPAAVPNDGGTASARVTNVRKLGSLVVTKVVNWNGLPMDNLQFFTICITGPSHPTGSCQQIGANGGQLTWDDLIPGQYTVQENDAGAVWSVQVTGSPVAVPADGGAAAATVTNTRMQPPATISVTKKVMDSSKTVWSFVLRLDGGDPHVVSNSAPTTTWQNLVPNRTYTLTEDPLSDPWVEGTFVCRVDGQPVGEKLTSGGIKLTPLPNQTIACDKLNGTVGGTGLEISPEPEGTDKVYLPIISR